MGRHGRKRASRLKTSGAFPQPADGGAAEGLAPTWRASRSPIRASAHLQRRRGAADRRIRLCGTSRSDDASVRFVRCVSNLAEAGAGTFVEKMGFGGVCEPRQAHRQGLGRECVRTNPASRLRETYGAAGKGVEMAVDTETGKTVRAAVVIRSATSGRAIAELAGAAQRVSTARASRASRRRSALARATRPAHGVKVIARRQAGQRMPSRPPSRSSAASTCSSTTRASPATGCSPA